MDKKLNALAVGYAAAILGAVSMLFLSIAGNLGIYQGAVEMMVKWHMFFSPSFLGTITGMIEAAVMSFIGGYLFAWVYNKFIR